MIFSIQLVIAVVLIIALLSYDRANKSFHYEYLVLVLGALFFVIPDIKDKVLDYLTSTTTRFLPNLKFPLEFSLIIILLVLYFLYSSQKNGGR